jgi:hypothetical protein
VGALRLWLGWRPIPISERRKSRTLYRALASSEQIDAVYASFEWLSPHVTRIDDDRRRSDPHTRGLGIQLYRCFFCQRNRQRHHAF